MLDRLEFGVSDVELGPRSEFNHGKLAISKNELEHAVLTSRNVEALEIDIAKPGDSIRIAGIVDVLEPRTKVGIAESTFPGIATDISSCGSGRTLALQGMAITVVGEMPSMSETFVQEDSLIDMAGAGAGYSPFSRLTNLVIRVRLAADVPHASHMTEMRNIGVKSSRYLASLANGQTPDYSHRYMDQDQQRSRGVGKVVYVCSLISEGPLHDTMLYGLSTEHLQPTWLPVTHMIDGALVSSDLHYANQRTPTYLYQRNPIVEAILSHGEFDLLGIILTMRYGSHEAKRAAAVSVAEMAANAGADSVIVHPAVGGNAHVDAVDIVAEAEKAGLSSVLVLQEMAGASGADFGLVDFVPEADALVSTGNRDEKMTLAPLDRVLGPAGLKDGSSLHREVDISLRSFLASTSQVGAHTLTTVAG